MLVKRLIIIIIKRLERGSNACKTPRCICPYIFNRFPVIIIQAWSLKVSHFSTFVAHFCLPVYASGDAFDQHWILFPTVWHLPRLSQSLWDNRGKCHTVGKRIQCILPTFLYVGLSTHLSNTVSQQKRLLFSVATMTIYCYLQLQVYSFLINENGEINICLVAK